MITKHVHTKLFHVTNVAGSKAENAHCSKYTIELYDKNKKNERQKKKQISGSGRHNNKSKCSRLTTRMRGFAAFS